MRRGQLEELQQVFGALSNINRLELLEILQQPKGYSEIHLQPSRGDAGEHRRISREAVRRHIEKLREIGVVVEAEGGHGQRKTFVLDHARLFSLFERMRSLASVRPPSPVEGETEALDVSVGRGKIEGPHLVLTRGVGEGRVFEIPETGHEMVTIGRSDQMDISLDYDAFVSGAHAEVEVDGGAFTLVDLPENKNGTYVNWERLDRGGSQELDPGDVIGVGMSRLVFRA